MLISMQLSAQSSRVRDTVKPDTSNLEQINKMPMDTAGSKMPVMNPAGKDTIDPKRSVPRKPEGDIDKPNQQR